MSRPSYLFRMFSDELERLERLAARYRGKREALAAALLALEQQLRATDEERDALSADIAQRGLTLTSRVEELERRVLTLEQQTAPRRSASEKSRSKRP